MKRVLASIFALTLLVLGAPMASAANVAVTVSEPTHREIDGAFIDDD